MMLSKSNLPQLIETLTILFYVLSICNGQNQFLENPSDKYTDAIKNDITTFFENISEKRNRTFVQIIQDVIVGAQCVIPNNADSITRAALLQQCLSPSRGFGNETRCFPEYELGCFPMEYPWTSTLRPFPQPMRPDEVDVNLFLYTNNENVRQNVTLHPNITLKETDFDPNRNYTVFIVHGFYGAIKNGWMSDMKDAYFKHREANVFLVDWSKGAKRLNYLQVASNTRIVGAELVRFGKHLINEYKLDPQSIHLIGHSFGSHVCSYFAKEIPGVKRITALDPAQAGFEGTDSRVRLDKSDADFIDVIHTNGAPFIPFFGIGFVGPVGHVDIFMNGGALQPGCVVPPIDWIVIRDISDLALFPVDVFGDTYPCSHFRSIFYFVESLQNDCVFLAHKTKSNTSDVTGVGAAGQPIASNVTDCQLDECVPLGLDAEMYPGRGSFYAETNLFSPYCPNNSSTGQLMRDELQKSKL